MRRKEDHTEAGIAIICVVTVDNVGNDHNQRCTEPDAKNDDP